jgi:hypothetical protein
MAAHAEDVDLSEGFVVRHPILGPPLSQRGSPKVSHRPNYPVHS